MGGVHLACAHALNPKKQGVLVGNTQQILCNTCRFSAILCRFSAIPEDFLQYLQIFCNILQIFCNTCRFSATLQIFCNYTCRFSPTLCRFSAIPADFLQYLQISSNTLQNFCRASSDDINSCTAQRSSVALFPWWLIVFSVRLQFSTNFKRSHPCAYYVTSMLLQYCQKPFTHAGSRRHHERYTCWTRLENGPDKLPLVDFPPSSAKS